jgi:Tfp pilus assembly protein PilV
MIWKLTRNKTSLKSQAGITMIETMLAASILAIGSLGMMGVVIGSIASNNRNKVDSTQTMLATSILEAIDSTVIGSGSSNLKDCANNNWLINTAVGVSGSAGAPLSGSSIDYTQPQQAGYSMNYVVSAPCDNNNNNNYPVQGVYDVRWNLYAIGGLTGSKTYLLTVGAKLTNGGQGDKFFSAPVTLRVLSGN